MKSKSTIIAAVFLAVLGLNLYFGLPRLTKFTGVDETLWSYQRIPKFWNSVAKKKWGKTDINDKPGISLALISGIGFPFAPDPNKYDDLQFSPKTPSQAQSIEKIYFNLRLPIYIFTLFSLLLFYFVLKKLFGTWIALFSLIFIGLSPILLGISLIINPDSLLWVFMPLSFFSFLLYKKDHESKILYLSAVSLGFALLTKYVATFLFPIILLIIFFDPVFSDSSPEKKISLKKDLLDYLKLIIISLLTILVFFPAAWVDPKKVIESSFLSEAFLVFLPPFLGATILFYLDVFLWKARASYFLANFFKKHRTVIFKMILILSAAMIVFVLWNTYSGMKIYDFETFLLNAKERHAPLDLRMIYSLKSFFSAFFPLIFGITPLVFLLFIFSIQQLFFNLKKITSEKNYLYSFYILSFIIAYYLANSLSAVASISRYQIIIYPLASVLAAFGLSEIIHWGKIEKYLNKTGKVFLLAALIIFSSFSLYMSRPFFFAYSSDLLPNKYTLNLNDLGDGAYASSSFLNSLPEAKNLSIWTDKKQVCEKFIGQCSTALDKKKLSGQSFDYFVASKRGKSEVLGSISSISGKIFGRDGLVDPKKFYSENTKTVFQILPDGSSENYIKIISQEEVLASEETPPFAMPEIEKTSFPEKTCNVLDYGADKNGKIPSTLPFSKAVDDCASHGGGTVEIPEGKWLSGPIHLKSNVNFHLDKDATIKFIPDPKVYLPPVFSRFEGIEYYNYSPLIYAKDCQNIAITGEGVLDGQAELWPKDDTVRQSSISYLENLADKNTPVEKRDLSQSYFFLQPSFVQLVNCEKILIDGISIINSPNWTLHPLYSRDISIKNVTIKNKARNSDGIVLDSSENAEISDSEIDSGDDAIALKSGTNADGRRVGKPTKNIVIRRMKINSGHSALAVGSEMSGGVENVFLDGLDADNIDYGARFKSTPLRGGTVRNIWLKNMKIKRAEEYAIQIDLLYRKETAPPSIVPPAFENINVENLYCQKAGTAAEFLGLTGSPIKNLNLKDITISAKRGITEENVANKNFENVNIKTD